LELLNLDLERWFRLPKSHEWVRQESLGKGEAM
jgi:hypothetical protein